MLRKKILTLIRRAVGTQHILDLLGQDRPTDTRSHHDNRPGLGNLAMLPGTPYSRFALPLDYLPSRDLNPRYGYSHETIRDLEVWFEAHVEEYEEFLNFMGSLDVRHIAISLNQTSMPKPAWIGGAIAPFDSLALYAMVLKFRPAQYFEIGSGMTTCFAKQAIKDGNLTTKILSIDPEPRGEIDSICDEVIRDGLETCDLEVFDRLQAGDILFFDGSHRSFMNSDVTVFFIDVLPRLCPGVLIHIHDIMLPWDYPDSFKYWYWNEQYMLAVYLLSLRHRIRPLLPTAFICRSPLLVNRFATPFVDLGSQNDGWRGGGSMWFTHDR